MRYHIFFSGYMLNYQATVNSTSVFSYCWFSFFQEMSKDCDQCIPQSGTACCIFLNLITRLNSVPQLNNSTQLNSMTQLNSIPGLMFGEVAAS